ncbi:hypothetical protein AgCh_008375 [Apium graveolens]
MVVHDKQLIQKENERISAVQPSYYVTEPPEFHSYVFSTNLDTSNRMSHISRDLSFSISQAELDRVISNLSIKRKCLEDNLDKERATKRSKDTSSSEPRLLPSHSVTKTKRRSPRKFTSVFTRKNRKLESTPAMQNCQSVSPSSSNLDQSGLVEAQIMEDTSGVILNELMGVVAAQK